MKKSILSFFLFGAILSAAPVTANVTFVNGGTPTVTVPGTDYEAGPYTLKVNGKTVQAMCMDDFLTVGGSWKANITSVSGNDFSNTYLGNKTFNVFGQSYTTKDAYTAEAYLFSEIIKPNADRASIQEAAWDIMDPATLTKDYTSNNTKVENVLQDVYLNYKNFNTSGYQIISDVNSCNPNQEFMTSTPEPATFALLGGGLFLAGAARMFRRNKQTEVKA